MNANIRSVIRNSLPASHFADILPLMLPQSSTSVWSATKSSPSANTWKSIPTFTQGRSLSSAHMLDAPRHSDRPANSPSTKNFTKTRSSLFRRWRGSQHFVSLRTPHLLTLTAPVICWAPTKLAAARSRWSCAWRESNKMGLRLPSLLSLRSSLPMKLPHAHTQTKIPTSRDLSLLWTSTPEERLLSLPHHYIKSNSSSNPASSHRRQTRSNLRNSLLSLLLRLLNNRLWSNKMSSSLPINK